MSNGSFNSLLGALQDQARREISNTVHAHMPEGLRIQNPADDEDHEDDPDYGDGEEVSDGEDAGVGPLAFEHTSATDNLACAVAAYRMLGQQGDMVAQHPQTGYAFFGDENELVEYAEQHDMGEEWEVYDEPGEILDLPADEATMKDIVEMLKDPAWEDAKKQFEGFHWGDAADTTVVKKVPGIDAPLTLLGIGRRLDYFAKKEGEGAEYYHHFGEKTKAYPRVYALGQDTLVIHGGNMRVEDRGVVE